MKKLLLATTALALSAGMASAQGMRVTGDARMGVAYDSTATDSFRFVARARAIFTGSGTTDGGLSFGASFRIDNGGTTGAVGGGSGLTAMSGGSVFISGAFGRLTMGDVDGAAEWIVGDLHGVGLTGVTGIGNFHEFEYLSNGNAGASTATGTRPSARYQYQMGDFRFALSADNPGAATPQVFSIAAAYSFAGFMIGLGYENQDGGDDHWILGASGSFADIGFRAAYGESGGSNQYGLSVSAGVMPGTTVRAFFRNDFADDDYYGIGFTYDLGGGASLVGGIARDAADGQTLADFGVALRF